MMWRRRRRKIRPPSGVVLVMDDGTGRVIPCGVLREPALDVFGGIAWLVVPSEPMEPLASVHGGFWLDADDVPRRARLIFDVGRSAGER